MAEQNHFSQDHSHRTLSGQDAESGIAKQPHHSVGFWHPRMSKVRAHVIRSWAQTGFIVLILVCFIMAVLALYWAVLFHVEDNMRALTVQVVDFDGQAPYNNIEPFVGPMVTQLAQQTVDMEGPSLGYIVLPPSDFNNDPIAVRQAVYDFHSYAAIIVNANATALLMDAVANGNTTYDPTGAIQMILLSSRDETTYYNYILPEFQTFTKMFMSQFGTMWIQRLANNASVTKEMLAAAPNAVNPGVSFLQLDLRPFQPPTATPSVTIGLIYLIIMAFFSFSFFVPIHQKYITPQGHPPLHFWQFIIWRWVATVVSYVLISLAYSLVSLAFLIPFWPPPASPTEVAMSTTAYGRGTFPVYWMINFVGMMALGLASENVTMIVGQPWTALWLIFWVISNVSTAFYSIDLAPGFFKWGYAWPLHNIVEASRSTLFDLHSRIGLNFGVLFAWVAINTALFPLCCFFMRWKTENDKRKAEKEKDRFVVNTEDGEREYKKEKGTKPPIRKRGFMRGM
ncbi:putative MNNG and nitrosoguanidine resistance protein [Seiridium unicorne]|uniref:MNNG and nitrosoguanidine resistance protein n=1 Tax=Seiridium unicorne TaxID=138068 RepID=A0ABR2V313_9PEZI